MLEPGFANDRAVAATPSASNMLRLDNRAVFFAPPSPVTTSFVLAQKTAALGAQAALEQPSSAEDVSGNSLERLRIVKQSVSRAGLGSRAMARLVLRNDNDYPVKDIALSCAFKSRDGRLSTSRMRTIDRTVKAKSRETLPPTLVGFVNVLASDGKCALVAAARAEG